MDCRCPACGKDLGRRKLGHSVVARMEVDCTHCKSRIRVNVHRAETMLVLFNFVAIAVFFGGAYWLRNQTLAVVAFGAAMLGALALPLLEKIWLRDWPRYAPLPPRSDPPPAEH